MGNIKIKDIYFGKIDGYNEFLEYGQDICKELFFEFPNIDIRRLLNGSTYYVFGNKGTGKTMLLKYLESKVQENSATNFTEFLRFKRDVDDEQRNQLKRSALPSNSFEEIIESDIPLDTSLDCTLAWQVYLIKVIISRLEETEYGVFNRVDSTWSNLKQLIVAIYGSTDNSDKIKKILPKMKRGNIEIDISKFVKTSLEFEWVDTEKTIVSFNSIGKQIINLYSKLKPLDNNVYIFIDELELSYKKSKKYQRDITLIRDLVFAIEYLSDINRTQSFNVFIISALRTDVYKNIISKGMEINKTINDFGVTISWEQKGGNIANHPLLKMLEKRIHLSEEKSGYPKSENIWEEYFIPTVGNSKVNVQNYILDLTWYKPRDIIRLFSVIQKLQGNKNRVDQETFDIIRKQYAEESWTEFEEILTVNYTDIDVEGIKKSLTGISLPFSVADFNRHLQEKADFFGEVGILAKNHKASEILKDLYNIGVLGNFGENKRFVFKGDDDIDPMMPITIHYPLIRFFKASIIAISNKYKPR